MYENDYLYAVERNGDHLAHYGIKGMRWGVRKAIERGNSRALGRQYAKAQKKLAKLEKRANSGKKYARRAAGLAAGAAAAGGLAALGTAGVSRGIAKGAGLIGRGAGALGSGMGAVGRGISNVAYRLPVGSNMKAGIKSAGQGLTAAGRSVRDMGKNGFYKNAAGVSKAVGDWGRSTSLSTAAGRAVGNVHLPTGASRALVKTTGSNMAGIGEKIKRSGVSNNTIARIGAGIAGAGLAAGAGYNAYRAATTKRAAKKAAQFRSEMNKAFKGTQYANGAPRQGKKRRR